MTASLARRHRNRPERRPTPSAGFRCLLTLALLCAIHSGCAGGKRTSGPHLAQVAANTAALERLEFGMTRAESAAIMGEQGVRPPWANDRGIGPQVVNNPFDATTFKSPSGEVYEVDRYAVGLYGQGGCPFIRGEAQLVPLIFLEDKLVGWRWSYLASVLQSPVPAEAKSWSFGQFCGQASGSPD